VGNHIGVRGFEPPTSASQTLRAKPTALHPVANAVYQRDSYRSIGGLSGYPVNWLNAVSDSPLTSLNLKSFSF
jgi:hypothetical protein